MLKRDVSQPSHTIITIALPKHFCFFIVSRCTRCGSSTFLSWWVKQSKRNEYLHKTLWGELLYWVCIDVHYYYAKYFMHLVGEPLLLETSKGWSVKHATLAEIHSTVFPVSSTAIFCRAPGCRSSVSSFWYFEWMSLWDTYECMCRHGWDAFSFMWHCVQSLLISVDRCPKKNTRCRFMKVFIPLWLLNPPTEEGAAVATWGAPAEDEGAEVLWQCNGNDCPRRLWNISLQHHPNIGSFCWATSYLVLKQCYYLASA